MADHAPGPLAYRPAEFDGWWFIRDGRGHLVAVARPAEFPSPAEKERHREAGTDPAEANARRLVAAWNAVQGISTADLEKYCQTDDPMFRLQRLRHLVEIAQERAFDAALTGEPTDD